MIEFKPEGFDELADKLADGSTHVRISLNEGLREIGTGLVPILKRHTPVGATGKLRSTTRFQVIGGPGFQELQVRQGSKSSGGYFYGQAVRHGRSPGRMPPVAPLIPWVMKVLGIPAAQAKGVAYVVARKIGRFGIKANPYHRRALREASGLIQAAVNRMGAKVVAHLSRR